MNDHWDLEIGLKVDVKSVKKLRRDGAYHNENYHLIEIKNVEGKKGWLYGEADLFAFETFEYWILVSRDRLQDFVSKNVEKVYVDSPDKCLRCLYSRSSRKDVITMLSSLDLMYMSDSVIEKAKNDHFDVGDSVVPEVRFKQRITKIF
jgi:hypothetical protein